MAVPIREQERHRTWLSSILASAQSRNWYGTITVKFEAGRMVRVIKEESLKPPESDSAPPPTAS